jgi:ABC-type branched-subunit amino acid transport system permease subunit
MIAFELPAAVVATGIVVGLAYGAMAAGLVLVYRAQRVVNLANVQLGSVGAAVLAYLVLQLGVPWPLGLVAGVAVAALLGAGAELTIMRRLSEAPRLTVLVATVGLAQVLVLITYFVLDQISEDLRREEGFPSPIGAARSIGSDLVLTQSHLLVLLLVPPALLAVAAVLRFTDLGMAVRAAAENRDAAGLAGVPTGLVTTSVWAMSGALAGVTAIALGPDRGLVLSDAFSPDLLVRALTAAVVAGMARLGVAVVAGVGIGVLEQVVFWNWPDTSGAVELALLVVVLVAFTVQARAGGRGPSAGRTDERSSWTLTGGVRPLAAELAADPRVRWAARGGFCALVAVGALLPLALTNAQTLTVIGIVCLALLALSVTVLTGASGQVSLGQVAFLGLGAAVSYQVTVTQDLPFLVGVAAAAVAGAVVTVAVGLPALGRQGLFLAVTTLGFGLVAQRWLLPQSWMTGTGARADRPSLGGVSFESQHAYYLLVLAALVAGIGLVRRLLAGPVGRTLVAVRDNERQAAALGIDPIRAKLVAFALAGSLAAVAGSLYGTGIELFSSENFPVTDGLRLVSVGVIGGLGSVGGTVLAALVVFGVDRLVSVPELRLLTTSMGLLVVVLFLPGGLVQPLTVARDAIARRLARPRNDPPGGNIETGSAVEPATSGGPMEPGVTASPAAAAAARPAGQAP